MAVPNYLRTYWGGKVIKKLLKILLILLIVVLLVPTIIWFAVQSPWVQTYLVEKVTTSLERSLGSRIEVGKVDIALFNRLVVRNIFISDLHGDTLLYANSISGSFLGYEGASNHIKFHRVEINEGVINLQTDSLGTMNLTAFINALIVPKPEDEDVPPPLTISTRNVRLVNSDFRMQSFAPDTSMTGVNFDDLRVNPVDIDVRNLVIAGDTISMTIYHLSGIESSGLNIESFKADFTLCSQFFLFERIRLRSMGSNLQLPSLRFNFEGYKQLSDFINSVVIDASIDPSTLTTELLSYFVPGISSLMEEVDVSGRAIGTISNLRVRGLSISARNHTSLRADINLNGLPNFDDTYIMLDIKELSTSTSDITKIVDHRTNTPFVSLPKEVMALGRLQYSGTFTGFISDFVAYGIVTTDLGNISLDASIKPDREAGISLKGKVSAYDFNFGRLINSNQLGLLSLNASLKGSLSADNRLNIDTDATVSQFEALGYSYSNIKITGNITSNTYEGSILLDDPNLKLNFLGRVDLSDTVPVFDFTAFVPRIDLVALNLNTVDSISQASFLLATKFRGNNLDNSSGEIKVLNSMYRNQNGEFKTSDITITAINTEDSKVISLSSEFADGELRGKYNYANIGRSLTQLMHMYLPALNPNSQKPTPDASRAENPEHNDYIIRLRLKRTQKFTEVLAPHFRIAENTNIFCIYNPDLQTLTLRARIPELVFSGNLIKDISIEGQTYDSVFVASVTVPQVDASGISVGNLSLTASARDNQIRSSLAWNNRQTLRNMGAVDVTTYFVHPDSIRNGSTTTTISILPSEFYLNDVNWRISPATISIDSSRVNFTDIEVKNDKQSLRIGGSVSSSPSDSITIAMQNIDLSYLNLYTKTIGYLLEGKIDGNASVSNLLENPTLHADLEINSVTVNGYDVGNLKLNSHWYSDENRFSIMGKNVLEEDVVFEVKGDIYTENNRLDVSASINRLPLIHLEPVVQGVASNITGSLSGNIRITGTTELPSINGTVILNNTGASVDFTRTRYTTSNPIQIVNSDLVFQDFKLSDTEGRIAILNGNVRTDYLRNISLDLTLAPNNFQFLNTSERDNEYFYGTVFATGQIFVTGTPSDLNVIASVKTEPQTALFLPLSSTSEVDEHSFVTFVSSNPNEIFIESALPEKSESTSNLSLTLNMEVTPDAEVQLIIDKKLGDIIRANGSGKLRMEINPGKNVFQMFGDYEIERGDYLFTLMGVINKRFRVAPGGTIRWGGDVTDANLDIDAIYAVRAPLFQLIQKDDERYKRRTNVECKISLTGRLMEPEIKFGIDAPDADPELRAELLASLNTEESINTQFLSLLVISNFTPPNEMAQLDRGMSTTVSEMLSNQLSNMISQVSDNLDFGINWRPGDPNNELTPNEVELALSTRLFNDRVSINSNLDMGGQANSAGIAGDFNVDVKINRSGKLRMKAFARSNDNHLQTTQAGYTGGAGIVFREDFNSLSELIGRIKAFIRPKESALENEGEPTEG